MSKILGLIVILLICVSCNQKRKAEMSLSSYTHDFGIISSDIICRDSITITNVGNARLVIVMLSRQIISELIIPKS